MPTVPTGSYRLAEQIGSWAIFADIMVSAVERSSGQPIVTVKESIALEANSRDLAAITFGAAYALGYARDSEGIGIRVDKLHTNPVDTTPMALAFAACHAVFNCLGLSPISAPLFDRETKSFVFPSRAVIAR